MRILAMQALRHWSPSIQGNRDIVEGRIIHPKHRNRVCIEGIQEAFTQLLANAQGELLLETLRFASANKRLIPKKLCSTFVRDETLPISVRAYALEMNAGKDLVDYALQNEHWQLRAAARDTLLRQNDLSAEELLLDTIENGEVFEAQEAIKSLAKYPHTSSKIKKATLRDELKLDYAETWSNEIEDAWLLRGGNPVLGKQVVFKHSNSECLRCHTIDGKGGIAGPVLDGIAERLDETQLLTSLLVPNEQIAEGFGEYSAMPPMGALLSKREIRDVLAYLKTLQ
jgi:cytochrome c553